MQVVIYLGILISLLSKTKNCDYFITYDFEFVKDTANDVMAKPEQYYLFSVEGDSYYLNGSAYYNDSLASDFRKRNAHLDKQEQLNLYLSGEQVTAKRKISDLRAIKQKDRSKHSIILADSYNTVFLEEAPESCFNWQLQQGSETILGYKCRKATTSYGGRNYTAWFTTDIALNDGPYVFSGLPGLILKIEDDQGWYKFEAKGISLKARKRYFSDEFKLKEWATSIDRKTYIKKSIDAKENPKALSALISADDETKLNIKSHFKKRFDLVIEKS